MTDYGNVKISGLPDASKRKAESKDFVVEWAVRLDGDTISSSAWESPDFTIVTSSYTDSNATVRLSGGTQNTVGEATNTIITAGGETHQRTIWIDVKGTATTVTPSTVDGVLLFENGDYWVLENGDNLALEV